MVFDIPFKVKCVIIRLDQAQGATEQKRNHTNMSKTHQRIAIEIDCKKALELEQNFLKETQGKVIDWDEARRNNELPDNFISFLGLVFERTNTPVDNDADLDKLRPSTSKYYHLNPFSSLVSLFRTFHNTDLFITLEASQLWVYPNKENQEYGLHYSYSTCDYARVNMLGVGESDVTLATRGIIKGIDDGVFDDLIQKGQ